MTQPQPEWQVLLIGGSSGTGKTTLGQELGRHFGVPALLLDDIRIAIQEVTSPQEHPTLHAFTREDTRVYESPAVYCQSLIEVTEAMNPALKVIVAHHIVVPRAGKIIIEGDGILPQFVTNRFMKREKHFRSIAVDTLIKALFLHEQDADMLGQRILERGRGFSSFTPAQQHSIVEGAWHYGQHLTEEAQEHGLPLVPCRPFDTLFDRVCAKITSQKPTNQAGDQPCT